MRNKKSNPNTPEFWDKKIFNTHNVLIKSPFYIDKIAKVTKFLKKKQGRLLDIGFGAGYLEEKLVKQKTTLKLFGIDFSKKAVLNTRKYISGTFIEGRADRLPFESRYFDWVVILDVLEHFTEKEVNKVFSEITRVIKKNGHLIISVPLNENLEKMNNENANFNRHLREYTVNILDEEVNTFGYKIIKREHIIAFKTLYFVKKLLSKVSGKLRKPNLYIVYAKKL